MKIIALYNIKGVVSKTTAAVNLTCLAASDGSTTLVWGLDPQGLWEEVKSKLGAA